MDNEAFYAAQEEAKGIEKRALDHTTYSGDVQIEIAVDIAPKDLVDLTYSDLLNLYERTRKILSAQALDIYSTTKPSVSRARSEASAKTEEVESKLREITTETKEMAEKIGEELKKPIPETVVAKEELQPEQPSQRPSEQSIEFETITPEEKKKAILGTKGEAPPIAEFPDLSPSEPGITEPVKSVEKKFIIAIPQVLKENPDEAAEKRFNEMKSRLKSALGEKVDEKELKKKMLELTKQLFKEKSANKREEIKAEIAVLKNLLAGTTIKSTSSAKGGKKVTDRLTNTQLLESIITDQTTEMSSTKDSIVTSFKKQISDAKTQFSEHIKQEPDESRRKQAYESLVFNLTSLAEQLPSVIERYQEFLLKKHLAELQRFEGTFDSKEISLKKKVQERVSYIERSYPDELSAIKDIISRKLDNDMEVAGREVLSGEKEKGKDAKSQDVIFEINEMDEGTLLYYLHSKDQQRYREYERKQLSRAEAVLEAKILVAKEKGLSEDTIRKYLSNPEG